MSILQVDNLSGLSGTDITIEIGKAITGAASQFKITGGTAGQVIQTDGSGGLSFTTAGGLPAQASQSGKFLTTDGSAASWATVDALPTQTSNTGKFLTTDGSAASWIAVPDELPTQTGQAGEYLKTDGTDVSWASVDIQSDTVTYDMMQDIATGNRVLGASAAGTVGEVQITAAMIDPAVSLGDFSDGGDTGGAARTIGNNDAYSLGLETNSVTALSINTDGIPEIPGGLQANSNTAGVSTTLSGNINDAVTDIPVAALDNFPVVGTIIIGTEQITFTGKSAATGAGNLTGATRGANTTTAVAHTSAAVVGIVFSTPDNYNALSAGPITQAAGSVISLGASAVWTIV